MKVNFENVKKIMKVLDEITEKDIETINTLIDFRDEIVDEGLKYDIVDKFNEGEK